MYIFVKYASYSHLYSEVYGGGGYAEQPELEQYKYLRSELCRPIFFSDKEVVEGVSTILIDDYNEANRISKDLKYYLYFGAEETDMTRVIRKRVSKWVNGKICKQKEESIGMSSLGINNHCRHKYRLERMEE